MGPLEQRPSRRSLTAWFSHPLKAPSITGLAYRYTHRKILLNCDSRYRSATMFCFLMFSSLVQLDAHGITSRANEVLTRYRICMVVIFSRHSGMDANALLWIMSWHRRTQVVGTQGLLRDFLALHSSHTSFTPPIHTSTQFVRKSVAPLLLCKNRKIRQKMWLYCHSSWLRSCHQHAKS